MKVKWIMLYGLGQWSFFLNCWFSKIFWINEVFFSIVGSQKSSLIIIIWRCFTAFGSIIFSSQFWFINICIVHHTNIFYCIWVNEVFFPNLMVFTNLHWSLNEDVLLTSIELFFFFSIVGVYKSSCIIKWRCFTTLGT